MTSENYWAYRFSATKESLSQLLTDIYIGNKDTESELYIHRYFDKIAPEDSLLLWQSGPEAGFYALGHWTSTSYRPLESDKRQRQAGFKITHVFQHPILAKTLKNHPILNSLEILKRPQSRLFKLSDSENEEIKKLFAQHGLQTLKQTQKNNPLEGVFAHILKQGFRTDKSLIRRYSTALETSPLVILKGLSGVGKTWLTELYAEAIGAEYLLLPVSPQWSSPDDILGYYHPIQQRHLKTPLWHFINKAHQVYQKSLKFNHQASAFHVVFDELNLSRIEHYFAPFLSALEIRRRKGLAEVKLFEEKPLILPPNLFFIGTINEDEHVQVISNKVYDRAQVLELSLHTESVKAALINLPWKNELLSLWELCRPTVPFGLRVIDEINHYIQLNQSLGIDWTVALDEQIEQKLWPKWRGLGTEHKPFLTDLIDVLAPFPLSQKRIKTHWLALDNYGFLI